MTYSIIKELTLIILLIDTREAQPLEFLVTQGITVKHQALPTADYAAIHERDGQLLLDPWICERKNISDLFNSFGAGYEAEKTKLEKAKGWGLTYVLAIEASATEVLKGHTYWAGGELRESQKSGLAMLRQLFSLCRRHGVVLWFCSSRTEMAWRIQEFYLTWERMETPPLASPEASQAFGCSLPRPIGGM